MSPIGGTWRPAVDPAAARSLVGLGAETGGLLGAVRAVADRRPDDPAVVAGDDRCTYDGLVAGVDATAKALADAGPGPVVGVLTSPGATTVVAMLAVNAVGSAHVVLDPRAAAELIAQTLDRFGVTVVVVDPGRGATLLGVGITTVAVAPTRASAPGRVAIPMVDPDAPASLSTTSGSTGAPKAVVHSGRNLVTNARRFAAATALGPDDRVLSTLPFSFVAAGTPTWSALITGATLLVHDLATSGSRDLVTVARDQGATVVFLTAGLIDGLLDRPVPTAPEVRLVVTGGDRLDHRHLAWIRARFPAATLLHRFNTSETHWVAGARLDPGVDPGPGPAPIGWTVPWLTTVVVAPDGSTVDGPGNGELVVRGERLALGYHGDPDRTAARFSGTGADRTYRTGDLVRRDATGLLWFVERADQLVKIDDVLVDRTRVERAIDAVPGVHRSAVTDWTDDHGRRRLAAFAVTDPAAGLSARRIRRALIGVLTPAEIPGVVELVDDLPLSPIGKLDVPQLRDRAAEAARPGGEPPRTPTEVAIAGAAAEILGVGALGRDDDLFALDADSLDTVELLAYLRDAFGVDVDLPLLFEHPTPAALAALVDTPAGPTTTHHRARGVPLVTLTSGDGTSPPVVLFGGGGGAHLDGLGRLARRLGGREVVAALPRGFARPGRVDLSLGAHARHATRAVVDRFGDTPVALAGYSAGGVAAVAVARRLTAAGRPPTHVVLVDSYALTAAERRHRSIRRRMARRWTATRTERPGLRGLPAAARVATVVGAADLKESVVILGAGYTRNADRPRAFRVLTQVWLRRHRAHPYPGDVVLLRSQEDTSRYTREGDDLGWSGLVHGTLEVQRVPGAHLELLDPPWVGIVAAALERVLSR